MSSQTEVVKEPVFHNSISDDELLEELQVRFKRSRKAFSDITTVNLKLREMNQKLEQSERLKSNFLSNIRNEINNPLNAIIGLATEVLSLTADNPQASKLVSLIHDEAFNLDFQLRNIFIAAELEAGSAQPSPTLVNLKTLLSDTLESFRAIADLKQITLSSSLQMLTKSTDSHIACDAEKLALIMSNLVANAIEFSNHGSTTTVVLTARDEGLHLRVEDTGIGILEEDIPKIFDRFSQLDSGSTRAHHGHGLGLSIVKSLIELLEGSIEVHSRPLEGTCIDVRLPIMHINAGEEAFGVGGNLFLFDTDLDEQ